MNLACQQGLHVLNCEYEALGVLCNAMKNASTPLGSAFVHAIAIILSLKGHVVVTGIGKSGIIARKIQATLASTGTPSFFIHPAEASHGDLGMLTEGDGIMVFSHSGETRELTHIVEHSRRKNFPIIAITSQSSSTLAKQATIAICLPKVPEASPYGLAPTTSTLMQLALGDAFAVTLSQQRQFSRHDFGHFHPGGSLGASLRPVSALMHYGSDMPLVNLNTSMQDTIMEMTRKAFGCAGIVDKKKHLVGVITDGDLRRALGHDLTSLEAKDVMTSSPQTVSAHTTAGEALHIMNDRQAPITALFIVEDGQPLGIIHVHDLIRSGLS